MRNPLYHRPCYHCNVNEPNRHSNFCDECLAGKSRPLDFSGARSRRMPLTTRLLYVGAVASAAWMIAKTIEYVRQ